MSFNFGTLRLDDLFATRARIRVYPSCQREKVWELRRKQRLIDTIFRNLPMPPVAIVETEHPLLGMHSEVVDGQQRIEAVIAYMNNEFPTARRFADDEDSPLYPNLLYSQLPTDIKSRFDGYHFPIVRIDEIDSELIPVIFRRWQLGVPLSLAETLFSFEGSTKEMAKEFSSHEFWRIVYSGETQHRQPFQAGVKMLLLEYYGGFANLTTPRQKDAMALRKLTESVSEIRPIMLKRLDLMSKLFYGASIKSVNQAGLMYQTIMQLEQLGYDPAIFERGTLAVWFQTIVLEALEEKQKGNGYFFSRMERVNQQRAFWRSHLESLISICPPPKDKKRFATYKDKVELWIKQDGKCYFCRRDLLLKDSIAHHVAGHAIGGMTKSDNLNLLHPICHQKIHREKQDEMKDRGTFRRRTSLVS